MACNSDTKEGPVLPSQVEEVEGVVAEVPDTPFNITLNWYLVGGLIIAIIVVGLIVYFIDKRMRRRNAWWL